MLDLSKESSEKDQKSTVQDPDSGGEAACQSLSQGVGTAMSDEIYEKNKEVIDELIKEIGESKKSLDSINPNDVLEEGFTLLKEIEGKGEDNARNTLPNKALNYNVGDKYSIKISSRAKCEILNMVEKHVCEKLLELSGHNLISELIDSLRWAFNDLCANPYGGKSCNNNSSLNNKNKPLLIKFAGQFVVFYQVDEESQSLLIDRIERYDFSRHRFLFFSNFGCKCQVPIYVVQ